MRNLLLGSLILATAVSGCSLFHKKQPDDGFSQLPVEGHSTPSATVQPPTEHKLIVTPSYAVTGKVLVVNETTPSTRFVVIGFPIGKIPALNSNVGVFRQGNKVAEVKLTGPQSDENIVAEIVGGDPIVGDEVRSQ